MICYNNL